jgi:hypothetical protein
MWYNLDKEPFLTRESFSRWTVYFLSRIRHVSTDNAHCLSRLPSSIRREGKMNSQLKQRIIDHLSKLIREFPDFETQNRKLLLNIRKFKNDGDAIRYIKKSKADITRSATYNKRGIDGLNQLIDKMDLDIEKLATTTYATLHVGGSYGSWEICSLVGNFNVMVGMYKIDDDDYDCVVIKSEMGSDSSYPDHFIFKTDVAKYYLQAEKNGDYSQLSHKANRALERNIMSRYDVHLFTRENKNSDYTYQGVYYPVKLVEDRKAVILARRD